MTQPPRSPEWPTTLAAGIATELRRYRRLRGMSAQQLSDECSAAGMPIQRSVIANFENGRRTSIGVAEVLIFAAALGVPPMALIFPAGHKAHFEGLPGLSEDPYMWSFWFSGELPGDYEIGGEKTESETVPMDGGRALMDAIVDISAAKSLLEEKEAKLARHRSEGMLAEREEEVARAEHQDLLDQLRVLLDREATESLQPDEWEKRRAEREKIHEKAERAYARMRNAMRSGIDYKSTKEEVRSLERTLKHYEQRAREIIAEIQENDWLVPDFGEEWAYLIEDNPESVRPPDAFEQPDGGL